MREENNADQALCRGCTGLSTRSLFEDCLCRFGQLQRSSTTFAPPLTRRTAAWWSGIRGIMTDMNESMFTALILFRMLVNSMQRFKQTDVFCSIHCKTCFVLHPILSLLAQRRDADAALATLRWKLAQPLARERYVTASTTWNSTCCSSTHQQMKQHRPSCSCGPSRLQDA